MYCLIHYILHQIAFSFNKLQARIVQQFMTISLQMVYIFSEVIIFYMRKQHCMNFDLPVFPMGEAI